MTHQQLQPNASAMMASLRSIGYTLETAIADIIDNSITAKSTELQLHHTIDGNSLTLAILDNGLGMDLQDLMLAMTFGSKNPLMQRDKEDLGRFGLGLKTASFSQCKKLTVISKKSGNELVGACWDLDYVVKHNQWDVEILDSAQIAQAYKSPDLGEHGTLVVWEECDRLIGDEALNIDEVFKKFELVEKHLQLVFHRLLSSFNLYLNHRKVQAIDPFARKNHATQISPEVEFPFGTKKIKIQAYTLPHHSKSTKKEYEENSLGDYLARQGFYVYRNKRLLIYGTWFRLLPKKELYKLTRIVVDLPNDMDAEWEIDIKKSAATPPAVVKGYLKNYLERFVEPSKRVYAARGFRQSKTVNPIWQKHTVHNQISYELNDKHPLIQGFVDSLSEEQEKNFHFLLNMMARNLPLEMIYADYGSEPQKIQSSMNDEELEQQVREGVLTTPLIKDRQGLLNLLTGAYPFSKYSGDWANFLETELNG